MATPTTTILGEAIEAGIKLAEADKPQILAAFKAAGGTVETAVDGFINSVKVGGTLGLFWPSVRGSVIQAVNQAIEAGTTTEADAVFDLLVHAAQHEANVLLT